MNNEYISPTARVLGENSRSLVELTKPILKKLESDRNESHVTAAYLMLISIAAPLIVSKIFEIGMDNTKMFTLLTIYWTSLMFVPAVGKVEQIARIETENRSSPDDHSSLIDLGLNAFSFDKIKDMLVQMRAAGINAQAAKFMINTDEDLGLLSEMSESEKYQTALKQATEDNVWLENELLSWLNFNLVVGVIGTAVTLSLR
jgi:hypothetical protein